MALSVRCFNLTIDFGFSVLLVDKRNSDADRPLSPIYELKFYAKGGPSSEDTSSIARHRLRGAVVRGISDRRISRRFEPDRKSSWY